MSDWFCLLPCIDGTIDNGTETLSIDVVADETWFIFVDGWNNNLNEAGLYDLAMDVSCGLIVSYDSAMFCGLNFGLLFSQ